MKLFRILLIVGFFLLSITNVHATESLVFDSTNNYIGACRQTNKSTWELQNGLTVSKFQIWYKWNQNETSLPVTILLNNEKFASFEAKRGDCDPYQTTWCNADFMVNKDFPKGVYTTEIPNSRQCLKPGGTGTVRLYSTDSPTPIQTPSPTITPAEAISTVVKPTEILNVPILPNNAPQIASCTCNQTTTIAIAAALSSALSIGISLLLRKK